VTITLPYGVGRRQHTQISNNTEKRRRKNLPINEVCDPKENEVFHKGKGHNMTCLGRNRWATQV
jgi:hypothetical protein